MVLCSIIMSVCSLYIVLFLIYCYTIYLFLLSYIYFRNMIRLLFGYFLQYIKPNKEVIEPLQKMAVYILKMAVFILKKAS